MRSGAAWQRRVPLSVQADDAQRIVLVCHVSRLQRSGRRRIRHSKPGKDVDR